MLSIRLCYLCSMLVSLSLLTWVPGHFLLQCCMIHQCSQGQAIYALYFSGLKPNTQDPCWENTGAVDTVPGDICITMLQLLIFIDYFLPLTLLETIEISIIVTLLYKRLTIWVQAHVGSIVKSNS